MKYPLQHLSSYDKEHHLRMRDVMDFVSTEMGEDKYSTNIFAFEQTQGRCLYCGKKLYVLRKDEYRLSTDATFDHLIPVSYFGIYERGNIAMACKECNTKRQTMTPERFYNEMCKKEQPVLFDTFPEFKECLTTFYNEYKRVNPRFFDLGYKVLYKSSNLNVELHVSTTDNLVTNEIIIPVYKIGTADIHNKKNNAILFPKLKKHIEKLSSITNEDRKEKFSNAIYEWFNILNDNGFTSIDKIKTLSLHQINSFKKDIAQNHVSSLKLIYQAIKLTQYSLDLPLNADDKSLLVQVKTSCEGDVLFNA